MTFFPEPTPPPAPPTEIPTPAWLGPPDDELPGVVPIELVIGRSDDTVVSLGGVRAYHHGLVLVLSIRTRTAAVVDLQSQIFGATTWRDGQPVPDEQLRWGLELSDGRRVTSVDRWPDDLPPVRPDGPPPTRPVLAPRGGSSDGRSADQEFWLWPLPPVGRTQVACEWPARGIALTLHDLPTDEVLAAASRAQPLWP